MRGSRRHFSISIVMNVTGIQYISIWVLYVVSILPFLDQETSRIIYTIDVYSGLEISLFMSVIDIYCSYSMINEVVRTSRLYLLSSKSKQKEFRVKMYSYLSLMIIFDCLVAVDALTIYSFFKEIGGLHILSTLYLLEAIKSGMKGIQKQRSPVRPLSITTLSSVAAIESVERIQSFPAIQKTDGSSNTDNRGV